MNDSTISTRSIRFNLPRAAATIVVLWLIVVNWRFVLVITSGLFWLTTIATAGGFFALGRRVPLIFKGNSGGLAAWAAQRLILLLSVALLMVVLWSRHRLLVSWVDVLWPRPFPYPDVALLQFHDWLDARYPAPPGHLKIHGEFYTVLFTLNVLAWICGSVTGYLWGAATRRKEKGPTTNLPDERDCEWSHRWHITDCKITDQ